MDIRFVQCGACEGYGATVHGTTTYELGCGYGHDDAFERPCPTCEGTGRAETEVQPVECDDDLEEIA